MRNKNVVQNYAKAILTTGSVLAAMLGSLISTEVAGLTGIVAYFVLVLCIVRKSN